jgi:ABC-2 type transport system permease protein
MHLKLIRIIAKQEWNSIFRSKVPLALYAVLLAVSLLATFTGWQYVSKFSAQQATAREEVHDHWMKQPERHPHRVAHYGYLVFREKSPLSFFDFGLDSYVGNSVFLEAHRQNTVNMSEAGFSNGMLRFGELSMAMVLQVLVPLLIIFIGFQTVAGLKQNGVLKILLCQRASYLDILLGKTMGLTAVTWLLFLPLLLFSLFCGMISLGHINAESMLRIVMIVTLYGLYFLVITMLVVAVSAMAKSAKNALMTLVLIWILFFIVIPKSAQTLGNSLYEAPDKIAFEHGIENDVSKEGDSHNPDDPHFSELKINTLKKYGVDSIQALPVNYGALVMQEGENITSRIFNQHYDRLISIYKAQNSVSSVLSFADPYLAIPLVSIWIFLCILFPGIANVIVNNRIPVPEAAETAIRQREGYHEKWDLPKTPTMEKFYAVYPQYRKYPIPQDQYSPGWYYAMQFAGDLESATSSERLFEKLSQRQLLSETIASVNPVIAAQQLLNKIANTDLVSHIRYLQSVKAHHRNIREYFYPFIFENTPTESLNWAGYPPYKPNAYTRDPLTGGILAILIWSALSLGVSIFLFKRNFIQIKDAQNA